jgi:hypothetical protein
MLIEVHGYSAIAAGAAFLPLSAIMAIGSRWSGGLGDRFGSRMPLVLGSSISDRLLSSRLFGQRSKLLDGLLPGLFLVGIGLTLVVPPLTAAVFESVPASRSGSASRINNAVDVADGLIAVAAIGLAYKGSGAAGIHAAALSEAFAMVKFAAGGLALSSALIAAMTIETRQAR